jgi:hypothetical protein
MTRAIDGLVNVHLGDQTPPKWMVRVNEDYFKAEAMFQPVELDALIDEMDANGVERAILMANFDDPIDRPFRYAQARPDRFSLALGGHDLLHPMDNLKQAHHGRNKVLFASDHPVLPMSRCIPEATRLDLPADVLNKYLFRNADRLSFNNEAA